MKQYRYLRGSRDSRETVEADICQRGQYITSCVVDVALLLCGITAFPCGNGDDVRLTSQQQLDILELVQSERKKITSGVDIKTMESWYGKGQEHHLETGFLESMGATAGADPFDGALQGHPASPVCKDSIPTTKTLKNVFSFPHNGKAKSGPETE